VSRHLEAVLAKTANALATPLSQLHGRCFPEERWPPQAIAEIMAISGFFGCIAWEDEEATGLALALLVSEECELLTLGVVPEHRRTGIGSALIASIVDEARRRGARNLFLEVAEDNSAARALYAARGFVQISRRNNYYRRNAGVVDALVLRLLVST
jgi:[ribosomal protein S18]-alanine N-acetyltransferase